MIKLIDIPGALDFKHIRLGAGVDAIWRATGKRVCRRKLWRVIRRWASEQVWIGKPVHGPDRWERLPKNWHASWEAGLLRNSGAATNKTLREAFVMRPDGIQDRSPQYRLLVPMACDLCGQEARLDLRTMFDFCHLYEPTHFFCPACHAGAEASAKRKTNTFTERLADRSGIADCERLIKAILSHKEQPNAEHA